MGRTQTIATTLIAGVLVGWAVPLDRLFDAFQPIITALAIMVAAVFVRLNRGMPSLEWKSIDPEARKNLTSRILALSQEYGWIIALNAFALIALVVMTVVGKAQIAAFWPSWLQRITAGLIGGIGILCIARMAYVVWRDVDVVRLQKHLIDGLASGDLLQEQVMRAEEKVTSIRSAGMRKVEVPPPKAWGE